MRKVLVGAVVIAATAYAVFFSPLSKIKSVELIGQQNCLNNQNQLEKYQVLGNNILLFNSTALGQNLKNDFSCIDQIKIEKAFPSKLKISITAQEPVVKIEGSDLAVSKNGAISQSTQANLPTIFLPTGIQAAASQKISDPTTLFALDVIAELQKSDFTPQNVRIVEAGDIAVYNNHGLIALFASSKVASTQVDSLQQVLAKAKIDEAKIARIDLRFDKPVIVNK